MGIGLSEAQVLDMPLDKYKLYIGAAAELDYHRRRGYVMDTATAVGGVLTGEGLPEYIESLGN